MVAVREPTHIAAGSDWELGGVNAHVLCIWELFSLGEGRKDEQKRDLNSTSLKKLGAGVISGQCEQTQRSWAKTGQVPLISI